MPDWQQVVRTKLAGLNLAPLEKEQIIAELAGHLQETYEGILATGLPEQEAARRTLSEVVDWPKLCRHIVEARRKEVLMQDRLLHLWIPGFLTLTLSMSLLMLFQKSGFQPSVVAWSTPGTILFYVPWLCTLPLCGALGSYLSFRAGGSRRTVLLAGIFPVLSLVACFLVILPFSLIVDRSVPHNVIVQAFLAATIAWILVPGAGLLTGSLLLQNFYSHRSGICRAR